MRDKSSTSVQRGWPNGHRRNPRKPVLCVTWLGRAAGGFSFLRAAVRGHYVNYSVSTNGGRSFWSPPGKKTLDSPEGLGAPVAQGSQMSRHRGKGRLGTSLHPAGRK